jgi:hypothetical protein
LPGYKILSKAGKFFVMDIPSNELYDEGPFSTHQEAKDAARGAELNESTLGIVNIFPPLGTILEENRRKVNETPIHTFTPQKRSGSLDFF